MTKFKMTSDGSQITEKEYKCKNPSCQQYDHMRRFSTSLTPSGSVKAKKEFGDTYESIDYDEDDNLISLGLIHTDESEDYTWNFVECRICRSHYIIELSYKSLVGDPVEKVFPLF